MSSLCCSFSLWKLHSESMVAAHRFWQLVTFCIPFLVANVIRLQQLMNLPVLIIPPEGNQSVARHHQSTILRRCWWSFKSLPFISAHIIHVEVFKSQNIHTTSCCNGRSVGILFGNWYRLMQSPAVCLWQVYHCFLSSCHNNISIHHSHSGVMCSKWHICDG